MITKEEYIVALTVVETFHRQLDKAISAVKERSKVPISEFIQKVELTARVRRTLDTLMVTGGYIFLEDINESEFLKLHNAGRYSWREFVEKRNQFMHDCWLILVREMER